MKVILKDKPSYKYVTNCQCGCRFSFEWEDIVKDNKNQNSVQCPSCKEWLSNKAYIWKAFI